MNILSDISLLIQTAVNIFVLILGILVIKSIEKKTCDLGISFIATSLAAMLPILVSFLKITYSSPLYYPVNIALAIMTFVLTLANYFFICRYIDKSYGLRKIYLPVMIILIASKAVNICMNLISDKIFDSPEDYSSGRYYTGMMISDTVSVLFNLAILIIIIAAFYRNSKSENVIPAAWAVMLILPVRILISYAYTMFALHALKLSLKMNEDEIGNIYLKFAKNYPTVDDLISIILSLAALALPVYVFVMTEKAAKKAE